MQWSVETHFMTSPVKFQSVKGTFQHVLGNSGPYRAKKNTHVNLAMLKFTSPKDS